MIKKNNSRSIDSIISLPLFYQNWLDFSKNKPKLQIVEFPIYTDSPIIGDYEFDNIKFINPVCINDNRKAKPAIIVRYTYYSNNKGAEAYNANETLDNHYHGGCLYDEIASLVSLFLGIRAQAGNVTRIFDSSTGPLGNPVGYKLSNEPYLANSVHSPQIPRLCNQANLESAKKILNLKNLEIEHMNSIIKVARTYQQALWIADIQPELSWLLFVSAIETAADSFFRENIDDSCFFTSEQKEIINNCEDCEKNIKIKKYMRDQTRATKKFIDFLLKFLPQAPIERPKVNWGNIDFEDNENLKKSFDKIYGYRSRALHNGIPFPAPMCISPTVYKEEKSLGLGCYAKNAYWESNDCPMLLHAFEHIVRGAILNWIENLSSQLSA